MIGIDLNIPRYQSSHAIMDFTLHKTSVVLGKYMIPVCKASLQSYPTRKPQVRERLWKAVHQPKRNLLSAENSAPTIFQFSRNAPPWAFSWREMCGTFLATFVKQGAQFQNAVSQRNPMEQIRKQLASHSCKQERFIQKLVYSTTIKLANHCRSRELAYVAALLLYL